MRSYVHTHIVVMSVTCLMAQFFHVVAYIRYIMNNIKNNRVKEDPTDYYSNNYRFPLMFHTN